MKDTLKWFGLRLKQVRIEQGLKVEAVAVQVGIEKATLYGMEAGRHGTNVGTLIQLAHALGVLESDLLVFPGLGLRHDVRELIRRAPPATLQRIKTELERELGAPESLLRLDSELAAKKAAR